MLWCDLRSVVQKQKLAGLNELNQQTKVLNNNVKDQ